MAHVLVVHQRGAAVGAAVGALSTLMREDDNAEGGGEEGERVEEGESMEDEAEAFPVALAHSDARGRDYVATRPVAPGELVLRVAPLAAECASARESRTPLRAASVIPREVSDALPCLNLFYHTGVGRM